MVNKRNVYAGPAGSSAVTCNGQQLPLYSHVFNHSPSGFRWGYGGSGPAQLALAIMCHEFGEDLNQHPASYQNLKWDIISHLPTSSPWVLYSEDLIAWAECHALGGTYQIPPHRFAVL